MTPEVTKQDLEALISRANEKSKKLGLTLNLDPSKINIQYISHKSDNVEGGEYDFKTDVIILNVYADDSQEWLASKLVHEGVHQKVQKEIVPYCHPSNLERCGLFTASDRYNLAEWIFNEGLAYATNLADEEDNNTKQFFDGIKNVGLPFYLMDLWPSPELSYAVLKACESGMPMDEIFAKTKEFLAEPHEEFPHYEIARFIKEKLNQDPVEIYELCNSSYKSWAAKATGEVPQ
jgi:hypothetical protein